MQAAKEQWNGNWEGKRFYHISTDEVYGALQFDGTLFTAVSYTHLDVYKRQVLLFNEQTSDISFTFGQWLKIFLLGAVNDWCALTIGFAVPVSYTHLELHRQFIEHLPGVTIDDQPHGILGRKPPLVAIKKLFLGFQYPVEIPGVSMANFMKIDVYKRQS